MGWRTMPTANRERGPDPKSRAGRRAPGSAGKYRTKTKAARRGTPG
jgi:hypothetical protein